VTERQIQREAVAALRKLGYIVFVTSTNRASRCTVGTPDIFVGRKEWKQFTAIEFKSAKGRLTSEQEFAERCGCVNVCRSVEEVMEAIM
jgi:hypothetical protein